MSEPYIENTWAGLPHFECAEPDCPFDTLDEQAMQEHVREHEAAAAQQEAVEAARAEAAAEIEQQPQPEPGAPAIPPAAEEEPDNGEDRPDEDHGAVPDRPVGGPGADVHGG
jgi:hypothetical protein